MGRETESPADGMARRSDGRRMWEGRVTQAIKPTTRLSLSNHRERGKSRQIVVTIHPTWLAFRLYKSKRVLQLDIEAAYQYAARLKAQKDRAEKLIAKKQSKKGGAAR